MASSSKCPGVGLEMFFKLDSECTEPGAEQFRELWELCSIHCTSWPDFRSLFTTFPGYRILILINIVETILILILNDIFFFDFLSPKIKRNTPFKINKKGIISPSEINRKVAAMSPFFLLECWRSHRAQSLFCQHD